MELKKINVLGYINIPFGVYIIFGISIRKKINNSLFNLKATCYRPN